MKRLILGDSHFGFDNENEYSNMKLCSFFTDEVFPYMKENNIRHIDHLGDLLDKRKKVNPLIGNMVNQYYFKPIIENKYILVQIIGNHDAYYNDTNKINSPSILLNNIGNRIKNIGIVDHTGRSENIVYVAWGCFEKLKRTGRFMFGHFPIQGFEYQNGIVNKKGYTIDDFKKFDLVFSGHFHKRDQKNNIIYVGSPIALNFGELGCDHGFYVLDTDTGEFDFVKSNTVLFEKIVYDEKTANKINVSKLSGKHVKIVVSNTGDEKKFLNFKEEVEKKTHRISIVSVESEVKDLINEENIGEIDDIFTVVRHWATNIDGINHDLFYKLVNKIHKDALMEGI